MSLFSPRKRVHMPSSGLVMYTSGRFTSCDPLLCWISCFAFRDDFATVPAGISRSVTESCTDVLPLEKRTMAVKHIIYN